MPFIHANHWTLLVQVSLLTIFDAYFSVQLTDWVLWMQQHQKQCLLWCFSPWLLQNAFSFSVPVPVIFGWMNNVMVFTFEWNLGENSHLSPICYFSPLARIYVHTVQMQTHWLATDHSFQTIFKCIWRIKTVNR